jgi:uncharacterized protein (DUF433 family)
MEATNSFLTLKEACVLAQVPEAFGRREVDRNTIAPTRKRSARRTRPAVLLPELATVYLRLIRQLSDADVDLPPLARRDLYSFLTGKTSTSPRWTRRGPEILLTGTPVALLMDEMETDLHERVRIYRRGQEGRIVSDPAVRAGEPVFAGTRIPVSKVGHLRNRGRPVSELLEHFPGLTSDDIEFAAMHVALGPPPGRPSKKPLKLRRIL